MQNDLLLLILEAMVVYFLVLCCHSMRHRFGLAPFYALIGGITAVMSWVTDAGVKVEFLRGFLPICAHCKKIRDDEGYWQQIEGYIQQRSEAKFSHGICPECARSLYPELEHSELK